MRKSSKLANKIMIIEVISLMADVYFSIKRPQRLEDPPSGERVALGTLPMFHAYGLCVYVTGALNPSWKFVLIPRFVEEDFLRCIQV